MRQEKSSIQIVDFIFIYIGGAFIAGWLQQLLRQLFPTLQLTSAGRVFSGLWLQDLLMFAVLVFFLRLRHASWQSIGARRLQGARSVYTAVVSGLLLYVLMIVIVQILNSVLPGGLEEQNVQSYLVAGDSFLTKAFIVFSFGVFVPLVEEFIFRGYLYHSLCSQLSPRLAMLFCALIFGACHFDWQRFLPLVLGGYLLNVVSVRANSVFASAISHGVWNSTMVILYYLTLS